MTSNLEKSDGLVHYSVKNAAVLCENHRFAMLSVSDTGHVVHHEKHLKMNGRVLQRLIS